MNRWNNAIPPTLKTKAFEETESVSKNIARRLYQVVTSNNAPNNTNSNGANNFESRAFPAPLYRPIAKSHSTPNLRTSAPSTASSPSPTPSPRPVPILESSPASSQQQRKQTTQQQQLQRRALSLQDLAISTPETVEDTVNVVEKATEKDASAALEDGLSLNKHRSFFSAATSVLNNQFSAALFLLPHQNSGLSSLTRSNLVEFSIEKGHENAVVREDMVPAAAPTLEEDDYVPYAIDDTEFVEEEQQQIVDENNSFGKHCYHISNANNNNNSNNGYDQYPNSGLNANSFNSFSSSSDGNNNNNNLNNILYASNNIEWCAEPDSSVLSSPEASSEDLDNDFVQNFLDATSITDSTSSRKPKRRVSFDPMASVILIPTKEEYYAAGLEQDLWWRSWEMKQFKYAAYREVQYIMETHGLSHSKEAFRRMSLLQYHQDEEEHNQPLPHNNNNGHIHYHHKNQHPNAVFGSPLHMSRSRSVSGSLQDLASMAN